MDQQIGSMRQSIMVPTVAKGFALSCQKGEWHMKKDIGSTVSDKGKEVLSCASAVLPPHASAAFLMRRAHLAFDRLLGIRLARHRIKTGYYNYLRALWVDDQISQRALSDATRVTESTTVAILKGMVTDGLIERTVAEDDKRKVLVSLTPLGRSLEPLLLPDAAELNAIATKGITEDEINAFLKISAQIAGNLEAAFADTDGARSE